jgi:hypothetical protein
MAGATSTTTMGLIDPGANALGHHPFDVEPGWRSAGGWTAFTAQLAFGIYSSLRAATAPRAVKEAAECVAENLADDAADDLARAATRGGGALRRVGDVLESVDDILANPNLLQGLKPSDVMFRLRGNVPQGWRIETLGKGAHEGQGFVLRQYTPIGKPKGPQIRWHPGGGHHGPEPYWRVIDANTKSGIIR